MGVRKKIKLSKAEREQVEILKAIDRPLREYKALADAANRLNCPVDDLLDKGISGELDLYAPVLDEGAYVWPVTDRGIRFSRLIGSMDGVDPVFRARLQYGEYALLPAADIKKIKIERSVKPEGFICPEMTLAFIKEWEVGRQTSQADESIEDKITDSELKPSSAVEWQIKASERMMALARQVSWVPASSTETRNSVIRVEMLRLASQDLQRLMEQDVPSDAATSFSSVANGAKQSEPHHAKTPPEGIEEFPTSAEIASAFAEIRGKKKSQWADMLKSPPDWLKPSRTALGRRGHKGGATWDPLGIARALHAGVRFEIPQNKQRDGIRYDSTPVSLSRLDTVFSHKLPAWQQAWQEFRPTLESYIDDE